MTLNRKIADLINAQGDVKQDKTLAINAEQMDSAQAADVTDNKKIAYYDSLNLLPIANLTNGDRAFVGTDSNNARLYISNGSGWYNTGMVNTSPAAIFDDSSYSIDSADDTLLITLGDSDFDQANLTYSFAFEPSNITDSAIDFVHDSARSPDITITAQDGATGVHDFKILGTVNDGNAQHTDSANVTLTLQSITLSSDVSSVNEGNDITYSLQCTGLADTLVGYTLSGTGITAADIDSDSLSGFIHINSSNQGSLVVSTVADYATEGTETITMSIDAPYDTVSTPSSVDVTINDTSLTAGVSGVSRSSSSVNEGSSVTFTVNTTNMPSGNRVYYRITGISAADINGTPSSSTGTRTYNSSTISSEAGYITVNGSNQANLTINFKNDNLTEGNETCYFRCTRLATSTGTTIVNNTSSTFCTVNDTSVSHPTATTIFHNTQTGSNQFTDYTWTIPANVTNFRVWLVGGGGGGATGSQAAYGGGGGGGGAIGYGYITGATPGATWKARVARGGYANGSANYQTWLGRHVGAQVYNSFGNAGGGANGIQGHVMGAGQDAQGGAFTNWTNNPKDTGVQVYLQGAGSGASGGQWYYVYGQFTDNNGFAGGGGGAAGYGGRGQIPGAGQSTARGTHQSTNGSGGNPKTGAGGTGNTGGCGGGGSGKGGGHGGSFGNQVSASLGSGSGGAAAYTFSQSSMLNYGGAGGNLGGSQQLAGGGGGGGGGRYSTSQTQSGQQGHGGKIIIQYGAQSSQQQW